MELIIDGISKNYGKHQALDNISLRSGPGLLGLVGPNGAGKTTLMRIIATLMEQTAGLVSWNGFDTRRQGEQVRRVLGYLPQDFGFYPEFSARRFLQYLAVMKGLSGQLARQRVDEVLELVNLNAVADRRLGTYSGGMRQRVGIAQALLNDPQLLIVDEPTVGLDPTERIRFRTLLASLTADRLVILSTHIIADVEAVANQIVILRQGRKVADASPEQMLAQTAGKVWLLQTDVATAQRLQAGGQVSSLIIQPNGEMLLRLISPTRPHEKALPAPDTTLEDAYLYLAKPEPVAALA